MNKIFMVSMLHRTQPYSDRQHAERALAHFIITVAYDKTFRLPKENLQEMFSREEYKKVIDTWNEFVIKDDILMGARHWKGIISEEPIDHPFF